MWTDGGQKVWYVTRKPGNQTFLAGYPGILPGYPGSARKVWEKNVWVQFSSPIARSLEGEPILGMSWDSQLFPGQDPWASQATSSSGMASSAASATAGVRGRRVCLEGFEGFTRKGGGEKHPENTLKTAWKHRDLVDVLDILFFCRGGGRGSPRLREGGAGFLLKIPGGGRGSPGREGPRGREGLCGELGNFGEGGGLIFFCFLRGRNVHQAENTLNVPWMYPFSWLPGCFSLSPFGPFQFAFDCLLAPIHLSCCFLGCTLKGSHSLRGHSRHLLGTPFSEPPSQNPFWEPFWESSFTAKPKQAPFSEPFPRTFSDPFLERCVAVQPLRFAPDFPWLTSCYDASFFLFAPFSGHPSSSPFLGTFRPFLPSKMLCSVEQETQHRAWRGAVSGWTSLQSSGRKLLP